MERKASNATNFKSESSNLSSNFLRSAMIAFMLGMTADALTRGSWNNVISPMNATNSCVQSLYFNLFINATAVS